MPTSVAVVRPDAGEATVPLRRTIERGKGVALDDVASKVALVAEDLLSG